jgi:hypothetical protein
MISVRAQAAITPDGHVFYSIPGGIISYGSAKIENKFFIKIFIYNASYVIFSKYVGINQF